MVYMPYNPNQTKPNQTKPDYYLKNKSPLKLIQDL